MKATVVSSTGSQSEPFKVQTGVKQGCIIAPTVFAIFIAVILYLIAGKFTAGVEITYRMDGKLFRLSRLKAKSKISTTSIVELQYADGNAIFAHSEKDLQTILNVFADAYACLGFTLNIKKTKVLYQPSPNEVLRTPSIKINGVALENVDRFLYFGSHLSSKADIDGEIQHRLSCASVAFSRLRHRVFEDHDIQTDFRVVAMLVCICKKKRSACGTLETNKFI